MKTRIKLPIYKIMTFFLSIYPILYVFTGVGSEPLIDIGSLSETLSQALLFFPIIMFILAWVILIIDVFHNKTVAKNQRAFWVFLLIAGHFGVFPFYWYFHIYKNSKESATVVTEEPVRAQRGLFEGKSAGFKIMLLVGGLLPLVLGVIGGIARISLNNEGLFYTFGIASYAVGIAILALYIIDATRNSLVASNQKGLWIVLLILVNVIIFPVYWYMNVWKEASRLQI
ncbi:hypothetical protein [Dehalococcoides mccartyi]|uniref:Membrane protein, putative n=1 Tax=Dehalococcoides mccartyi (strain ATCC BAA-2266 / KCTC 15142 / 195) TaxID=243164 RepID=Q3Z7A4_DEHM1|nr:hypothetical protein [Dehalococcoides mccartyi]AAW39587.1 membrane protein, putative [Dehalococcoides mccartyi 195]